MAIGAASKITLDSYERWLAGVKEEEESSIDTSVVSEFLNPQQDVSFQAPPTSLEEFQPERLEERSLGHQVFTGAYTLDDLEKNSEFQTRAERFMESIKDDEDIFEYLRDSDFSLSAAMVRSGQIKGWSDQTKEDYNYLRHMFDNADLGSTKQFMQLAKDMTIDIVADPINWLAVAFFYPSGGLTGAAGIAAKETAKKGLLQLGKETLKGAKRPAIYGAAEGAAWAGPHDYFIQNAEVELGLRDQVDWGQVATTTGLGAGIGGIFGGAVGVVSSATPLLRKKLSKFSNESSTISRAKQADRKELETEYADDKAVEVIVDLAEVEEVVEPTVIDKATKAVKKRTRRLSKKESIKKIRKRMTWISNTFGKPVTQFIEIAENSPRLQQLLGQFRSDWSKTLLKGIDKAMLSTYGEELNYRMFGYLTELRDAVGKLNRSDVTWWKPSTYVNHVNEGQNQHLVWLLRLNADEFDDIAKLTKKDKVDPDTPLLEERARTASLIDQDIDITFSGRYQKEIIRDDLGNEISAEVIEASAKIRDILDRIFKEASGGTEVFNGVGGIPLDLMQKGSRVSGFFPRHFAYSKIIDDRGEAGKSGFENIIYKSEHSKPLLDPKEAAKIEVIDPLTGQIKKDPTTGKAEKLFPAGTKSVDEEVFGRTAYLRIKKLVEEGNEKGARKLKARLIVDSMLDKRYAPFTFGTENSGGAGASFLQHRVFTTIDDNLLEPYLENNVEEVLEKYIQNASRAITRTAYFGRTEEDFVNRWINGKDNIREQLKKAGVKDEEIANVNEKLQKMYRRVTGLDAEEIRLKGGLGTSLDVIKLTQQSAHLPLATVSSITEPMIMLSRMDTTQGKLSAGGQVGKAIIKGVKKDIDKFSYFVKRASGKEVKGFADMQDEYWYEAYKVGLAIEQGVMSHIEGLYGEAARGGWTRKLQNAFFKANLLTSWTGAVQIAAFTTGKRLIRENTEQLHLHNQGIKKLSKEKEEMLTKQLWDLGIDEKDAQRWYKNSLDSQGVFDEGRSRGASSTLNPSQRRDQLSFYENRYTKGANRFTREIILNPSTSEANRPLWFSHPAGQLLAQFAGYPTVFNNTILKRWSYESAEDIKGLGRGQVPQATGRILGTALSMTTVAVFMNALRSQGRSLEQEDETIILEAVQRWGGLGPADIAYRMQQNTTYGSGPAGTVIKALPGPIVSDVVDSIAYRKGIPEILATNTPFFSALPKDARDAYKKGARDLSKSLTKGMFEEDKPSTYYAPFASLPYAKGGVVTDVPNASVEPDEKKVRGLSVTYAELGGVLAQDVEDRKGYVLGGIVNSIARTSNPSTRKSLLSLTEEASEDEVIKHLTKEVRKAEPIFESNTTTSLYKKAEADKFAKNVDGEAVRYVNSDKLNELEEELRYSTELGVKATTKAKASGGKKIKYKGRLRLVRPLELRNVSPKDLTGSNFVEAIQTNSALRNNIINNSPLPKEDATKLVKTLVDDYNDTQKLVREYSEQPIEVTQPLLDIKQSIKARETLTDLGYDSIRYNDSEYILFDNNQFRVNKKLRLRKGFAEGGEVEKLTDKEYAQLFNVVKSEEVPQEERESAWRAITAGIRSSVGAISEGLSKVFTDEKGLTKEQVDFLRKSLYQGGRVQARFGDRIRKRLLDRLVPEGVTPADEYLSDKKEAPVEQKIKEDKKPVIVQEDKKQVISDERLAEHKEHIFNHQDFKITNSNRMRNARLLEDVIWKMESDQGKNPNIELNGPYQMSADTQSDAINLGGGLRAKHSKGKGLNFSEETLDYLENTPRNELEDNASRLLMNHIFFTRTVKGEKTGAGTKLLQDYHENPTWEKAQDIYLKLWVYHTKEEYAEIMKKQTGEAVDIGPNLLRGKEYFNENYGKSLQELQEIAPVKESWYPGKRIKEKIDEIPAHAEVYLKKVLFGDREPITEEVFSPEEYGRVTEGMKQTILKSLKPSQRSGPRSKLSDTFFDTQGRLRNRISQDWGMQGITRQTIADKRLGSYEPHFNLRSKVPIELKNILGNTRYNLKKGDYNTEKLTIDSDQYDFAEDFTGEPTEPGFNVANLREFYRLGKIGGWKTAAERFGRGQLPDQDTVDRWKKDYGIEREAEFVPVNMSFPVSDIFSKDEWANLQEMEGEETPVRVASLLEPPRSMGWVQSTDDFEEWVKKYMSGDKTL